MLWVQTRVRVAHARARQRSLSVILCVGRPPDSAPDLDDAVGVGERAETVVDPSMAHARSGYEIGDRNAFGRRE